MKTFVSLYTQLERNAVGLQSAVLLLLRLLFGVAFFLTGIGKLQHLDGVAQFFAELQIPMPYANAVLVGLTESIGGALLVVGLASRLISVPLAFSMCVALLTAHRQATLGLLSDPSEFLAQPPVPFLIASLITLAFGAGKISLDNAMSHLAKRCFACETQASATC